MAEKWNAQPAITAANLATDDELLVSDTSAASGSKDANMTAAQLRLWAQSYYQYVWLGAGAAIPNTTAGAATQTEEYATNDVMADQFLFDASTEESVQFWWSPPEYWDLGTFKARFIWDVDTAGSGDVVWGISALALSNDDAIDAAFGTEIEVTDTVLAVGDTHRSDATAAITAAGTPAAGDVLVIKVARKAADGGDTCTVDAKLLGIQVEFLNDATGHSAW